MSDISSKKSCGISTEAVHGRIVERKPQAFHSITTPVIRSSSYTFDDSADLLTFMENKSRGDKQGREQYGRYGNPTVQSVERRIATLDGGSGAILTASGMAAITTTVLAVAKAGAHVVYTDDAYSKTRQFCKEFLPRYGVAVSEVAMGDYAGLEAVIRPNTALIISESPTNPYMRICDLEQIVAIAKRHPQVKTMIDSTFATPVNQRPLDFGIDFVVHSVTKYLSGHNDLLAGAIVGNAAGIRPIRQMQGMLGAVADANVAYEVERGLKTLPLRIAQQNRSAHAIAKCLEAHPAIECVWYPGLASHPDHELAKAQMKGFGGVVSFEVHANLAPSAQIAGECFIDALQIPQLAPSLGGPESLVMQPAIVSYYDMTPEERLRIGMKDNLVRLSIGLEDPDDLIADLWQALDCLLAKASSASLQIA